MPNSSSASASRPLRAAILLSGAFFLSRLTGLLQLALINGFLPEAAADAYAAAFTLPDVVNYLVAGGAMSVTFIPIFTALERNSGDDRERAWRFFSTIATIMGVALMLLIWLGVRYAEQFVRWSAPGLTEPDKAETLALTVAMTKILLPAQFFFYLGAMLVGVLNAHKRFGASGFTGVVYNLVAMTSGFVLWLVLGEVGFAWGITLGALCGNFLLPLIAAQQGPRVERVQFRPMFDVRNADVQRFFINALPIMLGVSLPVVDQIVVKFFASELSDGALRNLTTGNRFMLAPLGIVAQAASVAAFPFLASDSAAQDWAKFSSFLRVGLRRLLFLTLPLSVGLILIAQPLLQLFQFGKFDNQGAHETAIAFAFYCVGLFAWAGQQLVARAFYALQDTRTPTIIGSVLTFLFFVPLTWFMARWGVLGLAFATSIGAGAHFTAITIALNGRLKSRRYRAPLRLETILGTMTRTAAACLVMSIVGLLADRIALQVLAGDKFGALIRLIWVATLSTVAFGLAASRFGIPEWKWLRDKILRRRAKAA